MRLRKDLADVLANSEPEARPCPYCAASVDFDIVMMSHRTTHWQCMSCREVFAVDEASLHDITGVRRIP